MSVPTTAEKQARRLAQKGLYQQLCAAFENDYGYDKGRVIIPRIVQDILRKVRAHYEPDGGQSPSQIVYTTADAKERLTRGKTMAQTRQKAVVLTMLAPEDCAAYRRGAPVLMRQRLVRWLTEAKDQGALLTTADLALLCGVSRDLVERRIREHEAQTGTLLPLRGTVHDASSKVTHKARIVELSLSGKTPVEIARETEHSLEAVENYVRTFGLVRELADRYDVQSISRLLGRGERVVRQYLELLSPAGAREVCAPQEACAPQEERDTPVGEPSASPSQAPTSLPGET